MAQPQADARTLARGGIAALHGASHSPAAALPLGLSLQAGAGEHFLGSGLLSRRVRLGRAGPRLAWSVGVEQLRSDVHREHEVVAAWQLRRHPLRVGLALGWREWHFQRHGLRRRPVVRVGIGGQPSPMLQVVCAVERRPREERVLRLLVGLAVDLQRGFEAALQLEREPALPVRLRASLGWRPGEVWGVLWGYDAAASSFSTGLVLRFRAWHVVCAVASHPELGWSRALQLEWQR